MSKAASVEFNSVNAVLLDAAGSAFDQLMVAAHVNVSAAGDRLSLRRCAISNDDCCSQLEILLQHKLASSSTWIWCPRHSRLFSKSRDQV